MSYFRPYVDESGYHFPSYTEILEELIDSMQRIFGTGIYLGNDSPDYQMISLFAEKIYDTYQSAEAAYNAHSPATSIGTGLDYIVAVNGISRKQPSKSVVTLSLTGTPGTIITSGIVADIAGIVWDLPETVVIGTDGKATVEATCREYGVITAGPNTVNRIMTPVYGWQSVTNPLVATVGTVRETDAELRARQADSVSLPSRSIVEGIRAGLKTLTEVERCEVYENDRSEPDENGIPGHSICAVVEGAEDQEVAEMLFRRKGPGCGTHGATACTVTDESGMSYTVRFDRLAYAYVDIELVISRRQGWSDSIPDAIRAAIVNYLDTFSIGTDLTVSIIWMIAQQINADARTPQFAVNSVRAARSGEELSYTDVVIAFNEVARSRVGNISITVV